MTQTNLEGVKVEQCDREALASYYRDPRIDMPSMADDLLSEDWQAGAGVCETVLMEILARHRLSARTPSAGAGEIDEAALDKAVAAMGYWVAPEPNIHGNYYVFGRGKRESFPDHETAYRAAQKANLEAALSTLREGSK